MRYIIIILFFISCNRDEVQKQKHLEDVVLENKSKDEQARKLGRKPIRGSKPTILVDFDGYYVSGTLWNTNGPIDAAPSGLSNTVINQIMAICVSHYAEFGDSIIVTTNQSVYNAAPITKRTIVIVTASYEWYSNSAGGVAYINSFTWGDDTPCFVFNTLYGNDIQYVAHAISHEAGHTIGLRHHSDYEDCIKIREYHYGCIIGEYAGYPSVFDTGPNSLGCDIIVNEAEFIRTKL